MKCVLVLGGAEPPSVSWGAGGAQHSVVWHCSIKLTESIKAALSYLTPLPFPLAFAVQAVHYGSALFLFYATVGTTNKVISMQGSVSRKAPLVTGRGFKRQSNIQKCMKNSKGVISCEAAAQFG